MKPILFNTKMVKAILEGRKTVTRRVVRPDAVNRIVEDENGKCVGSYSLYHPEWDVYPTVDDAPYHPGDILYVREAFGYSAYAAWDKITYYRADADEQTERMVKAGSGWRPSIHMPREAARIFLRVTDVRVERLQQITEEGARSEGAQPVMASTDPPNTPENQRTWHEWLPALPHFIEIWDSTIKPADRDKYGWGENPWVWVFKFERISKEDAKTK